MDPPIQTCRARLQAELPSRFDEFPVDRYIAELDTLDVFGQYPRVTPAIDAACARILRSGGTAALEDYHRLVLLALIERAPHRAAYQRLPDGIRALVDGYYEQVVRSLDNKPDGYYLPGNDAFCKDLAVCRQKLIPCGAQLIDVWSGIPRSVALKGGPGQWLRFPTFALTRLGGFKPLFEMHMDPRLVLRFNPEGWHQCYLRIAELLASNPEVLGVFGSSWWFDPGLADVSPRLDFLRDIPLAGGARIFYEGPDDENTRNALANSRQRQELFEQGRYQPRRHTLIWPREALLAWARPHTASRREHHE